MENKYGKIAISSGEALRDRQKTAAKETTEIARNYNNTNKSAIQ